MWETWIALVFVLLCVTVTNTYFAYMKLFT